MNMNAMNESATNEVKFSEELRRMAAFLAAGQIRTLADLARVTIDMLPFFYGEKIDVLLEGKGNNSINALVKKASDELFTFVEGGDYAPLHEAIEALKKRVKQELLRVEGFAQDGEFRFMDTQGIVTVPIRDDGKVIIRGKLHLLKKFTAYPEL